MAPAPPAGSRPERSPGRRAEAQRAAQSSEHRTMRYGPASAPQRAFRSTAGPTGATMRPVARSAAVLAVLLAACGARSALEVEPVDPPARLDAGTGPDAPPRDAPPDVPIDTFSPFDAPPECVADAECDDDASCTDDRCDLGR